MERALETWIVLLLVVAPWQYKVIAVDNSFTQSSKSLKGDVLTAIENSKLSKDLPENKLIADSTLQSKPNSKLNITESSSKLEHLPKHTISDNKSRHSPSYSSNSTPFKTEQKITKSLESNKELNSDIHRAIKRHIGAFLKTYGKPNFSRTENKRYSEEQTDFSSSENDFEPLISVPEIPIDQSATEDRNENNIFIKEKRNLGAFIKSHGRPVFRQPKSSINPRFANSPIFGNVDDKRSYEQLTNEDKRNLAAFMRNHGKPNFGNVDDKRSEITEGFEEDKRNIAAFLKSHGKPVFQNDNPKRILPDIEEDKRNLGAFLKSHGKPSFGQNGKRGEDYENEEKRNLAAFLKSHGKPVFGKAETKDLQENGDKRNLGAFLKSRGKPNFMKNVDGKLDSNIAFDQSKRNLGAFLKSHGKPVFEQSGNKRIAANEIIVDDKRNLGAFLKTHGKPMFAQSNDQTIEDQKRNLGAFLKSHGRPNFGQTGTKITNEEDINDDKRNIGAFLKQHGKPVFEQKDYKKSLDDGEINNQIIEKTPDLDVGEIVKKDEELQNNFPDDGNFDVKRNIAKFLKTHGKPVFSETASKSEPNQDQNSFDNIDGVSIESDKRNIASFMRNHGKPNFNKNPSSASLSSAEGKRNIGSFLNTHGKPVFSNNNKRPFRNGNSLALTKRHVGAFLNAHGKPVFKESLNATKNFPNESSVKNIIKEDYSDNPLKRHVGAFLNARGKPVFTAVDDKRLSFLDPNKRYGNNIVRLTRNFPDPGSIRINGEKEVFFPEENVSDLDNRGRFLGKTSFTDNEQQLYDGNNYGITKRSVRSFMKSHFKPDFSQESLVRQHRSISIANPFNSNEKGDENYLIDDEYPIGSSEWSSKSKRNVAVLARNGWLSSIRAPIATRFAFDSGSKREIHHFPNDDNYIDSQEDQFDSEECSDMDDSEEIDNHIVKRNIGALARSGRLPPWHRRREWWTYKRGIESLARMLWPRHPLFGSFADKRHIGYLRTPLAFKQKRCKKETKPESNSPELSNDINVLADDEFNKFDTQSSGGNLILTPQRYPGSSL